jgi:Uma2 family endonuclease
MTAQDRTKLLVEDFDRLVGLPENTDRQLEYIGGRIVEVVSNNLSSKIAGGILGELYLFLKRNPLGYLTGADGGYMVVGERYIPDVAFISKSKQPAPSREAYNPNPPDLAVEVLSPSNDAGDIRIKVANYVLTGTQVWVVWPDEKQIEVYVPGQPVTVLSIGDSLDGGDVLPGFTLRVNDVFADL